MNGLGLPGTERTEKLDSCSEIEVGSPEAEPEIRINCVHTHSLTGHPRKQPGRGKK